MNSEWVKNHAGICPVPPGTRLSVEFANGDSETDNTLEKWNWDHFSGPRRIVAYCIVKAESADETDPKDNPKVGAAQKKFKMSNVPACVLGEVGVAMTEGAIKYGSYNFRSAKMSARTYYDGTMRHLMAWWEGEDIDPDSGLHHVTKAIASLVVLRDSMINETFVDSRPPKAPKTWVAGLNAAAEVLTDKYGV